MSSKPDKQEYEEKDPTQNKPGQGRQQGQTDQPGQRKEDDQQGGGGQRGDQQR